MSEPGYIRKRETAVRRIPGAEFHSEPGVQTYFVPPSSPVGVKRRPSIRPPPPVLPPENVWPNTESDSSEGSDDISDTDSVDGFPFHAPSISESDIETMDEKSSNGKTESFSDVQALHNSSAQDVYSFEFSRYHKEEEDGTEVRADFVHRSFSTKTAACTRPIFQWV